MKKGDRVEIVGGKDGVGEQGVVFWVGPSKYGTGLRVGVKTRGGATVWTADRDLRVEGEVGAASPAVSYFGFDASDWHDFTSTMQQPVRSSRPTTIPPSSRCEMTAPW